MTSGQQPLLGAGPDTVPAAPPRVVLDWSKHKIGRVAAKCRICRKPAWMRDEAGKPCHKECAEQQLTDRAARAARAYAKSRGER